MSVEELVSSTKKEIETLFERFENDLKGELEGYSKKYESLKATVAEIERDRDSWKAKFEEADQKIKRIEGQLEETVSKLEEASKDKDKKIDMLELLDIYLGLVNNVFESSTHVRLLLMLHGGKDQYTMDELVKSSGIGGLAVRQAIHDLRNADVLDYDEEKGTIVLKQRFID